MTQILDLLARTHIHKNTLSRHPQARGNLKPPRVHAISHDTNLRDMA